MLRGPRNSLTGHSQKRSIVQVPASTQRPSQIFGALELEFVRALRAAKAAIPNLTVVRAAIYFLSDMPQLQIPPGVGVLCMLASRGAAKKTRTQQWPGICQRIKQWPAVEPAAKKDPGGKCS